MDVSLLSLRRQDFFGEIFRTKGTPIDWIPAYAGMTKKKRRN
jgi:hypothetical protein